MVKRKIGLLCMFCILAAISRCTEGYSGGAPIDACGTMTPRHGLGQRSTESSPFVLLLSKATFDPNENIMVMLRGLCKNTFRGFLIEARRADPRFNQTERMGAFTAVQRSRFECGRESSLTHITNDEKSSLLFNWTAPSQPIGDVIITATVVKTFSTFWVGVNSAVIKDNAASRAGFSLSIDPKTLLTQYITPCPEDLPHSSTTVENTTPMERTTPVTPSTGEVTTPRRTTPTAPNVTKKPPVIDTGKLCGVTRGCFSKCDKRGCDFNVQWRDMSDRVWFSIGAKVLPGYEDQWLALGFSFDQRMGDDSIVECMTQKNRRSLSLSYNYHRVNRRMLTSEPVIFPVSDTLSNGYLTCEFARIKKLDGNNKVFDLGQPWFIFLAQGPIVEGRMEGHPHIPWVSTYKANFQNFTQVEVVSGAKFLIKIHASLMTFAWLFCASIAIVLARFYKPIWPSTRLCGRKIWFTIHRLVMMTMSAMVLIAFGIIFWEVKGVSDISFIDFRKLHPVLGIIVTGLTVIQVIMGLARPRSISPHRPVFNWAHWCVGICDHILAVANIILGVGLKKAGMHFSVDYFMYCFAIYQVFIVLLLEVVTCNARIKEQKQQSYSIYADRATKYSSAKDTNEEDSSEPPGSSIRRIILVMHVLMVTFFTGGALVAIIVFS